jgi:glycosyltransferase involved in cell wall biosynthesis
MKVETFTSRPDILVFSHLRWEFVRQRPQHILSRMAKNANIFFIEEPIPFSNEEEGTLNLFTPEEKITVVQPRIAWNGFIENLIPLLQSFISESAIHQPMLWFYSAAFVDVIQNIDHTLVIYDCMDELSAFEGASTELQQQEKQLLEQADIVFTGGKSLYNSKRKFHKNIYCFPSAVDRDHFEKALMEETQIPNDISTIGTPIILYYGVIDERMDLQLLGEIAALMPKISFVLIGPVVKIDSASLPKSSNLHYLGNKSYQELPGYLKACNIAMMPFALNKATEFISPTKTLEYLAALKPVISTPVSDVVSDYMDVVAIVKNAAEFEKAVNYYLNENKTYGRDREITQSQVVLHHSWDAMVSQMQDIIEKSAVSLQANSRTEAAVKQN